MKYVGKNSLKITVFYILISLIWVFFIDFLLFRGFRTETYTNIEIIKGVSFILFSVGVLFFLHHRNAIDKQDYLKKITIETERGDYLINISDNGFILLGNSGSILECNTPVEKMLGISRNQLIDKNFSDLLSEHQLDGIESKKYINSKLRLVKRGTDQFFECYFNNFKKNSVFLGQVELTNSKLFNSNILVKIRDLSNIEKYQNQLIIKNKELKIRNEQLRNINLLLKESTSRFKVLFQNAPIAYQSLDIKGRFIEINNTWLNILGYEMEEVIGKHFTEFMTPNSAKLVDSRFKRFKEVGEIHDIIFEMVKKDGKVIYTSFHGKIGYNKDGSFKQTYCIFNDISDHIQKDKALKESYQKYKTVADFNYDWEYWLLPDGSLEYVSPSCERITGYTSNEFLQNPQLLNDIVVEEDKSVWRHHKMLTVRDLIKESEIIYKIKHKDGSIKWIGHYCSIVYDEKGNYLGRRGSNRDITGRIIAERIILQERDLARNILESTNAGIWDWNIPEHKLDINERWAEIIGYKLDELKPISVNDIFNNLHPDDEEKVRLLLDKVFKKEVNYYDIDYRLKSKTGEWVWVNSRGKIIEWSTKEEPIRMIGTHLDITKNKQLEKDSMQRIILAEEKERERIAKDLHDGVSPVLSAVKLYCQSLLDAREENIKTELVHKINNTINDSITSISEISNNISPHILKNFGLILAVQTFVSRILDLGILNISINSEIEDRFNENIEVNLYRITTELINNTYKYAQASDVIIKFYIKNDIVYMEYSDNGKGFDIDKIKPKSKGMGVLNIKNRIKILDGQFIFSSEPNQGIKINISIPLN